jgi:hypothetical protein
LTASSRPPPPISAMNSRRSMSSMGTSSPMPIKPADRARRSVFRHLSLPQRSRLVLGADLNCSESGGRCRPACAALNDSTHYVAALRDFSPVYVRFGS